MRKKRSEISMRKMRISLKRRVKLLDLVVNQSYSVVRASRKLELKAYTARSIVNKFRKEGLVYDYTCRRFVPVELSSIKKEENSEKNVKQEENIAETIERVQASQKNQKVKEEAREELEGRAVEPRVKQQEANQLYLFYYW